MLSAAYYPTLVNLLLQRGGEVFFSGEAEVVEFKELAYAKRTQTLSPQLFASFKSIFNCVSSTLNRLFIIHLCACPHTPKSFE